MWTTVQLTRTRTRTRTHAQIGSRHAVQCRHTGIILGWRTASTPGRNQMIQARGQRKGWRGRGGEQDRRNAAWPRARGSRTVPRELVSCWCWCWSGWAGLSCACSVVADCRFVPSPWRNLEMRAARAWWVARRLGRGGWKSKVGSRACQRRQDSQDSGPAESLPKILMQAGLQKRIATTNNMLNAPNMPSTVGNRRKLSERTPAAAPAARAAPRALDVCPALSPS